MDLEKFKDKHLTTKVIFDVDKIIPGDVIKVYWCDYTGNDTIPTDFLHSGIVEEVDSLRVKYAYYDLGTNEMATGYIHASDIPYGVTNERWEQGDHYTIFEVVE